MTPTERKLLNALTACRDRFAFYVGHHLDKGDLAKAAENEMFVALANEAIAAARQSEPLNFCSRCGKRLVAGDVHTCTPPMRLGCSYCFGTGVLPKPMIAPEPPDTPCPHCRQGYRVEG